METSVFSYAVTLALLAIGGFYVYAKYKLSYWTRKGLKSPRAHLIFGNMRDVILLKKPPGLVLKEIYDSVESDEPYAPCYLFHKPILVLRSPELIKQILVKDFEVFPNRGFGGDSEADPLGYVNLLGIKQPRWKYLRSKLTPGLTGRKLCKMLPLVVECGDHFLASIDRVDEAPNRTKSLELKAAAGKYCTDVFASIAFGVTTNSFDETNTEFFDAGQRVLAGMKRGIILLIHFFLPELIPVTALVSKSPAQFFRDTFWDSWRTRERVGNKRGDFLDSLFALKEAPQNPDFAFEDDNLVGQAVSFFVAGFEATSTAIAFTLHDLSKNPTYEARVYDEIVKIVGEQELTMEILSELTFLEKCVNESLRLHPPLPMTDRVSVRDYKIPGTDVTLDKGTTVIIVGCGTNMDPRFFKDPEAFNPERTDDEDLASTMSHLSFGLGPRSCIGQRFGLMITKVALVMILKRYTLVDEALGELDAGSIFTTVVDGIPLKMRKRL